MESVALPQLPITYCVPTISFKGWRLKVCYYCFGILELLSSGPETSANEFKQICKIVAAGIRSTASVSMSSRVMLCLRSGKVMRQGCKFDWDTPFASNAFVKAVSVQLLATLV